MEKLGLNLGYLLVQVFNFLAMFVVLRAWVYKPIMGILDKRRETIAQGLEDARIAEEARANAENDAQKIMLDAQSKANSIINEATERADKVVVDIKAEAQNEINKERSATLSEVEEERSRMLGDLRGQVAALAIAAAQKLVGESLDEKRQHSLLSEFFSGVKSGKVVILENQNLSGESAEVVSALPLTDEEQSIVKKEILTKMGSKSEVAFRIDPAILGGLVVRVGDKVLDGSVAGKLDDMRQNVK
ncbi:MAG TPA: F0F1 ATP synthase subunit B [Anaerolineales bacterium]|nr:F0F1 ATP synthase subunit B [Anaerolineales bacterium]